MSDCVLRVDKLANGYTVEVCDPKIAASNRNSKVPYKNPWREYAFSSEKEVLAFITKVLPKLSAPKDDMASCFDSACAEG